MDVTIGKSAHRRRHGKGKLATCFEATKSCETRWGGWGSWGRR